MAASWRKRLGARLPPLGSRVRISVSPSGFRGGRNGVWVGFSRGFSRFPLPQISPHSSHLFRSISSALVMVHQAWSTSTLATHGPIISGLHRISSLDPTLCWTRVEDIFFYIYILCGPGGSSSKVLGYRLDDPSSIPGVGGLEIFTSSCPD